MIAQTSPGTQFIDPRVLARIDDLELLALVGLTLLVAVPTGIKFFSWLGTLWAGSLRFKTPMLFVLGFLATFTIGGRSYWGRTSTT